MKNLFTGVAAVLALTAALVFLYWQLPNSAPHRDTSDQHESSAPSRSPISEDNSGSFESVDDSPGALFSPYRDIIGTKAYKLTITRQRRYGGNSVPVTTVTYFNKDIISITEAEGHSIATETFIDGDNAYCFNETLTTAYLMPAESITIDEIPVCGIRLTETGTATVGTAELSYERYETADGQIIDYLFAGTELKKMKLYTDEDYELISVEISTDLNGMRTELPEGIVIINNYN